MAKRKQIEGSPLIAVGYIRVSTDDQHLGPEAQREALDAWAARIGVVLATVRTDKGISGATPLDSRPGLSAALTDLRAHNAGVLVAVKRDRFARDVVVSAGIELVARTSGARVLTADGASDLTGPEGALMRGIVDVFAAYERHLISARTKAALAAKRARGERNGMLPYGQASDAAGVLVPHDGEQAVISCARELRAKGARISTILLEVNARGYLSRKGKPFQRTQIVNMLEGVAGGGVT